jgi:septal ring factor EnvC (AmiA/AmiB activator)
VRNSSIMTICALQRRVAAGRMLATALVLALPVGLAGAVMAEPLSRPESVAPVADIEGPEARKAQREQDLEAVLAEQRRAAEAEAKLKADIATIGEDRRRLSDALIETASHIRAAESRIAAGEARRATLNDQERTIRQSLTDRRAVIAEVLAALQRIGHRPPPALLVRPEDALLSVRTAMMLGAVLPEMRAEAQTLTADLGELMRVRGEITAERERAARDIEALSNDRRRMSLLVGERQKRQAEAEAALETERERAAVLARQAGTLKDLIARLEQDISARPAPDANGRPISSVFKDPGRLAPAIAFTAAKGALPMPVNGVKLREYGTADGVGGSEKGLSVATRTAAQVTAPCDGWVVYAGPFRSYGQLLILNAGGGYHVLLAGMERISVDLGQFVLTGEPVAVMGGAPQAASLVAVGSSQPVLYIEFRKDGTPVDPGPWWAINDSEKVRG